MDVHHIQAVNANYAKKGVNIHLRKGTNMFELKKAIIRKAFLHSFVPKVTDLVFIQNLKGAPEKTHKIKDNQGKTVYVYVQDDFPENLDYFSKEYYSMDPYELLKSHDINKFYYIAIMHELKVIIKSRSEKDTTKIYPLTLENSFSELKDKIGGEFQSNPDFIYFYQNNEKFDEVDNQEDLKIYYEKGLIAYTFPIKAKFSYNHKVTSVFLKFDKPLSYYIENIKNELKISSSALLFKIHNENLPESIQREITVKTHLHEILKKYNMPCLEIKIKDEVPGKISIKIPFGEKQVNFDFNYHTKQTIKDLITMISKYFNIQNTSNAFISINNQTLQQNDLIKKYNKSGDLIFTTDDEIKFERTFIFNENKEKFIIEHPSQKIDKFIPSIAEKINVDQSLISLSFKGKKLDNNLRFAELVIQPNEEIKVQLKPTTEFVYLNIYGINIKLQNKKFGFTPTMKISLIKEKIPEEYREGSILLLEDPKSNKILDESKTFGFYKIENDSIITIYTQDYHIFIHENKINPINSKLSFDEIKTELQRAFKLEKDSFFIVYDGNIYNGEPPINKCSNKLLFEVNKSKMLELIINNKDKTIKIENTKKVIDVVYILLDKDPKKMKDSNKKKDSDLDKTILLNEYEKPLNPESYLYESFPDYKKTKYEIQAKEGELYTFSSENGKFTNEYFLPTTKVFECIKILKNKNKSFNGYNYLISRGRVLDDKDSLSCLFEADEPIQLVDELPEEIKVTLKFKFNKDGVTHDISMIKGSFASDVRFIASQLAQVDDIDQLVLITDNNELNDDEELNENITITVDLNKAGSSKDDILQKTTEKISQTTNYTKSFTKTKVLEETHKSESDSDDSFLCDYEDDVEDIFEKGNGTYEPSQDYPDEEYIFSFKETNGEEFKLQLPKDVTVKDVKEKIAERNSVAFEDVTIFAGNTRLSDFNILTALVIPKTVHYFSVRIVDLKVSIICTRIK